MRPPSVDALARRLGHIDLPHPLLVTCARRAIADVVPADIEAQALRYALDLRLALLQPVVNATGVLLHTNLGRAPFAVTIEAHATNLEFDLSNGQRGSRQDRIGPLIAELCGAEAAMVVNNCAAAVLLVLAALADGREVLVSRGEAVEIGGGFRVPEVMAQSGARLVDVGTTNRTRLADYQRAMTAATALAVKVHPSNFRVEGFVEETSVAEMAALPVPVVADIGSGLLDANCPWLPGPPPGWLAGELAARQTLADGAALVTFSGDKLFAGPQAGIIAGRADLVEACMAHPLARALRPGALVLGALQDTALAYLRRDLTALPFWSMVAASASDLRRRAERIAGAAAIDVEVVPTEAVPGAGSVPGNVMASAGICLAGDHLAALRSHERPVIGRVKDDRTWLDLRSVTPSDDDQIISALGSLPVV